MEFNEKLQELRKQKNLTQEELAQALFVSRTAVSKWESGKGYPSIDSLKAIAQYFSISIDQLLSSQQVLTIAESDNKRNKQYFTDIVFGLLDICTSIFFILPLFAQRKAELVLQVSLLNLTDVHPYIRNIFIITVSAVVIFGVLTLALQNTNSLFWQKNKNIISILLNALATLLFICCLQSYVATVMLVFLLIKVLILIKPK